MRHVAAALLLLACLGACGGEEPPPSFEALMADGHAAFERGEDAVMAARTEASFDGSLEGFAEAVEAWMQAASAYRRAYRLLDPVPELREQRAMLAFRIARTFAKAARHGQDPDWADLRADHAFLWLDQTGRLVPAMRQVHYERARLFDSEVGSARDLVAAHAAYARYVAAVDAVEGGVPEAERPRVTHARERVEALAPR